MYDLIASILDGLIAAARGSDPVPDPQPDVPENVRADHWGHEMLARAAVLEQSQDPKVRDMGRKLRLRATALINTGAPPPPAPAAAPAPAAVPTVSQPARIAVVQPPRTVVATSPFVAAAPSVARVAPATPSAPSPPARVPVADRNAAAAEPLLAGLQDRAALLRAFVVMEALGAPIALRDEFGAPLMHR